MQPRCRGRSLRIAGREVATTPLVLPSFSSTVFGIGSDRDFLSQTVARIGGIVVSPILVSAYDLHHNLLHDSQGKLALAAPLTFIDSGGFEVNRLQEAARRDKGANQVIPYGPDEHRQALVRWPGDLAAVMVSYDTYSDRLADQVNAAISLCPDREVGRLLLLKPASDDGDILDTIEQVGGSAGALAGVDAVGLTEKEAGRSLRERLRTISALRHALDGCGLDEMPIHVFGGLDPLRTPLYFLAGADIFDGLSWLRYGYEGGHATYLDALASFRHPDLPIKEAEWLVRRANYIETTRMQVNMRRFLASGDHAMFHGRAGDMQSRLPGS